MSEKISMAEKVEMVVVNTAHDGYRRAGFVFDPGENTLSAVNVEQRQALEADPRLSVTVITTDTDNNEPGRLAHQDDTTTLANTKKDKANK
ncbi:HI1506-related protein [Photorhabdus viridis]|uniref:HI1506-related protein n=1 Tax=Photorhabdus viridis TaxID=3163327 RepID=UPI003306FDC8